MLTLERKTKNSSVTFSLRRKEGFFEKRVLIAFAIAFCLHGAGLLLFYVSPFHVDSSFTFAPIEVYFEQGTKQISSFTYSLLNEENEWSSPPVGMIPSVHDIDFSEDIRKNRERFGR